jgi:hypothetical protein
MSATPAKTTEPLRLLAVASRPSDFVEMADLARALSERGHALTLLYFFSSTDPTSGVTIQQLKTMGKETRFDTAGVDVAMAVPQELRTFAEIEAAEAAAKAAARKAAASGPSGLRKFIPGLRRPRMPSVFNIVRRTTVWMRRHNLHRFYPQNTWISRGVYSLAFTVDQFKTPREALIALRQMVQFRRLLRQLRAVGRREAIEVAYQGAAMVAHYNRYWQFFANSIRRRSFQAILLPEDIVGNIWPVAIGAGHRRGIPSLVLPYTLANREEAVQSLKSEEPYQTRNNELASQLFPKWRYQADGIDIVRLPSPHILAHEELRIAPPDPWMMNSGYADRILVDSNASLQYFLDGGIPREQMEIVGSVSQDRMFHLRQRREENRRQIQAELGLASDKPLLLISGCPNQLSAVVPFCEFKTMTEVARFVGDSVAPLAPQYNLVVRPHPNFAEFGDMLERFGVRSTLRPTASLVPLADLFIAFASATIRWAIACGVPTLNYDVFHYGYGDFAAARGVTSLQGSREFASTVRAMTPGSPAHADLMEKARHDSAHWSVLDGGSLVRIEDEIHQARKRRANA